MNQDDLKRLCVAVERIGIVLAAMYASHLGDVDQIVKTERLSRCGFNASDIAALLGTTTNAVNIALHRARKGARKSRRSAKAGK